MVFLKQQFILLLISEFPPDLKSLCLYINLMQLLVGHRMCKN